MVGYVCHKLVNSTIIITVKIKVVKYVLIIPVFDEDSLLASIMFMVFVIIGPVVSYHKVSFNIRDVLASFILVFGVSRCSNVLKKTSCVNAVWLIVLFG